MNLILRRPLLILAALALAAGAAQAAKKDPAKKDTESAAKPEKIGTYGDWQVFHSGAGKSKICYVLAEPKTRAPEGEKQEKAYAFISERPAEKVRNELSFVMGFEVGAAVPAAESKDKHAKKPKKGKEADDEAPSAASGPTASIGDEDFDLIPRGNDLWVKNPAEESKAIDEMRKGVALVIKASSRRGRKTTDTYSLSGFGQAVDKALKDCAG